MTTFKWVGSRRRSARFLPSRASGCRRSSCWPAPPRCVVRPGPHPHRGGPGARPRGRGGSQGAVPPRRPAVRDVPRLGGPRVDRVHRCRRHDLLRTGQHRRARRRRQRDGHAGGRLAVAVHGDDQLRRQLLHQAAERLARAPALSDARDDRRSAPDDDDHAVDGQPRRTRPARARTAISTRPTTTTSRRPGITFTSWGPTIPSYQGDPIVLAPSNPVPAGIWSSVMPKLARDPAQAALPRSQSRGAAATAVVLAGTLAMLLGTGACAQSYSRGPDGGRRARLRPVQGRQPDGDAGRREPGARRSAAARFDCHGQRHPGRPLRIYGQLGLRFVDDAGDYPGDGTATTETESEANYQAVIGLQPEIMSRVDTVQAQLPPRP